ncbi:MAG: hypothetical protein QOD57_4381 [Actinomycetota bacterium]|nr:hypothetical protein [Actinomycetota bacterium]
MDTLTVLVPHPAGLRAIGPHAELRALLYDAAQPPTAEQREATVMVVDAAGVTEALAFMHGLPRLELVQTLNAGYDQWVGRLPPGVRLSNARGAHGRAVAEWVVAGLLAHYRRLPTFAAAQARGAWEYEITSSLEGKAIGVLGAGDIGLHLQRMLEPLSGPVTLVGRTARPGVLDGDQFRGILPDQDAVVLALPLTAETRHLVDAGFLGAMKDGAVLVNAGRGPLVETDALVAETADRRLAAILDVTDPEPLPSDHPLWSAPGVIITPHVSGSVTGLWRRAWGVAAQQIELYARGEPPTNLVL